MNDDPPIRKLPLISIVIPFVENTSVNDLEVTLNSIFNQTYEKYEIIIASSFDRECICKGKIYAGIFKFVVSDKIKIADLLNLGLHQTSGDFVCFVKPGDILVCDYFSSIDKIDWAHPNVDWIIFSHLNNNITNVIDLKNRLSYYVNFFDLFNMNKRPFYISSSVCFRNRWVDTENGRVHEIVFDPAYTQYSFSDVITKYALLYPECYYNTHPVVTRVSHENNKNYDSIMIPAVIPLTDYICSHEDGFNIQKYLDLWSIHICLENLKRKQFYCASHNIDHLSDNYEYSKLLLNICCKCKIPISAYIKNL